MMKVYLYILASNFLCFFQMSCSLISNIPYTCLFESIKRSVSPDFWNVILNEYICQMSNVKLIFSYVMHFKWLETSWSFKFHVDFIMTIRTQIKCAILIYWCHVVVGHTVSNANRILYGQCASIDSNFKNCLFSLCECVSVMKSSNFAWSNASNINFSTF